MSDALTAPVLIAAGLLLVSGLAKLRAPATAARALSAAGLPAHSGLVRMLSAGELALATIALVHTTRAVTATVAVVYAGFAAVAMLLRRRRAACGCFGDSNAPASLAQAVLSAVTAAICAAAAARPAHDLRWVLAQTPVTAVMLLVGTVAAVYAVILVYTQLPAAWAAWSTR